MSGGTAWTVDLNAPPAASGGNEASRLPRASARGSTTTTATGAAPPPEHQQRRTSGERLPAVRASPMAAPARRGDSGRPAAGGMPRPSPLPTAGRASVSSTPATRPAVGTRAGATAASSSSSAGRGRDSGSAVATRGGRPASVVRSLGRQPGTTATAKGRAIQRDLEALGDDYFGGVESVAPPPPSLRPGVSADLFDSALSQVKASYTVGMALPRSWPQGGPTNKAGREFDASGSNLLCMDVLGSSLPSSSGRGGGGGNPLAVVGSADHGLRVFDLTTLRERRSLFNKTNGHTEWVTCCRFLSDGRVLSGGMDSKLCLWDSVLSSGGGGLARCRDLLGHTGSVADLDVNASDRAISAGYDRTLRIWDCSMGGGGGGREVGLLAGHKGPVMRFDWCGSRLLSGDRQGQAKVWDLCTAECLATMATKRGQIGAVRQFFDPAVGELVMFGDQGGVLSVLDLRQGRRPVAQSEVHPGGVVSEIRGIHGEGGEGGEGGGTTTTSTGPYVITCGADRRICVLDPRMGFAPVHALTDHTDFIYSMVTLGPLVVSGGGNGWVLVHDVRTGECCYGLGAGKNAIREIYAAPQFLVAAGDDGKAVVYDF